MGSEDLTKDFAKYVECYLFLSSKLMLCRKLVNKLSELKKMSQKATWKKILENEQDKSQINGIFKYIDEQTKTFQVLLLTHSH